MTKQMRFFHTATHPVHRVSIWNPDTITMGKVRIVVARNCRVSASSSSAIALSDSLVVYAFTLLEEASQRGQLAGSPAPASWLASTRNIWRFPHGPVARLVGAQQFFVRVLIGVPTPNCVHGSEGQVQAQYSSQPRPPSPPLPRLLRSFRVVPNDNILHFPLHVERIVDVMQKIVDYKETGAAPASYCRPLDSLAWQLENAPAPMGTAYQQPGPYAP